MKHRCKEWCFCPIHKTPLLYGNGEHACQNIDCIYGHGVERYKKMASVRDELIDELVNELDCSRDMAEKAVDKAIANNADDPTFGTDIEATADLIHDNQSYWED